jgi:hypothetical protein
MANHQRPVVDYASLVSLSNSSRIDAIKTMDQLSYRLSSSSRSSGKSRQARSRSGRSNGTAPSGHLSKPKDSKRRPAIEKPKPLPYKKAVSRQQGSSPQSRQQATSSRSSSDAGARSSRLVKSSITAHSNRMSYMSTSSNSTKLGEIPQRRSRLNMELSGEGTDDPVLHPVYPLRPYAPVPEKEKRGGLIRRLFGRREMGS